MTTRERGEVRWRKNPADDASTKHVAIERSREGAEDSSLQRDSTHATGLVTPDDAQLCTHHDRR